MNLQITTRCAGLAVAGFVVAVFALAGPARAALMTYTNSTAFLADLPGPATTLDFESLNPFDTIADGGTVGGITFDYPTLAGFGVTMEVRADFDTTSGTNYLGTDDAGVFQGGDGFDLSFAASNFVGMFFITSPDPIFDGDISLSAGGGTASLVAADREQVLADGGQVFFLGLIDDATTFSAASVAGSGPFFLYNVDDIVTAATAVPEPSSLSLLAFGLIGLWGAARGRRREPGA